MGKTEKYQPVSLMYLYKAEYVKSNTPKQMGWLKSINIFHYMKKNKQMGWLKSINIIHHIN